MLRFLRHGGKHTKAIWWVLIIVTVVTFLGGFVFIFGSGLSNGGMAKISGAVAQVNGQSITRTEYQNALNNQRQAFAARYGDEPGERELQTIEAQAFRSLVLNKLLDRKAQSLGLKASDKEVLLQLQTNPPQALMAAPAFQTNGQFDPQKYTAAMRDPNNNWAPFEQEIRDNMPVRKLQEQLFTSVKLTDGELRNEWRNRNERVTATVVTLAPDRSATPKVSDADLQKVYDRYKSRFMSGPQRRLEVLLVPKQFGEAAVKAASDLASSLVRRIRAGESFEGLSREYSDAPNADRGGVVDRTLAPSDFGPQLGPQVAVLDTGQVTDPVRDGGRFMFFKLLQKLPPGANGQPGVRVAQFLVRVKPDEDALRKQATDLGKLRGSATREGLGRAATTLALTTTKTAFFDMANAPNELQAIPSAVDWAFGAKLNDVSPVIEALDYFGIVQLIGSKLAGPTPREAIADQLRQLAELEVSIDALKPKADALAAALKSGQTLEQAAAATGLTVQKIDGLVRAGQDPRLFGQPEFIGRLFGAAPGQVIGPVRGLSGYVAGRLESRTPPDWTAFETSKAQFAQQMLESRQRAFIDRYTSQLRAEAKVKDLRTEAGY
jgi:peptidyl-prolyl cis-trans isomerase D